MQLAAATIVGSVPVQAVGGSIASRVLEKRPSSSVHVRILEPLEAKYAIRSLMAQSGKEISKEPSCQSILDPTKAMTLADALAETLVRTAVAGRRLYFRAECFVRSDYPLKADQEFCRIAWIPVGAARTDAGYGILFVMNWQAKSVDPQSIECY